MTLRPTVFLAAMALGAICFPALLYPQTGETARYIEMLEQGQVEEVRKVLPELSSKHPNDPGVLYLQGRLASDGIESVKSYQSIVDNFPKSEWADDALFRIYQYYYSLGLYKTAELKMMQLKRDYPTSFHVTGKQPDKLPEQEEQAVHLPTKEIEAPPETTSRVVPAPRADQSVEPYVLQTGAFSTATNAEKQKNFFEEKGFSVEMTNKVRGGKSLFLVWVGSYRTAEQAKSIARQVKLKYRIDSIVVERY